MQIVIDIPQDIYDYRDDEDYIKMCAEEISWALLLATPLPKGHGRLIDADSVNNIVRPIERSDCEWAVTGETVKRLIYDVFDKAPTIIEADTERSEDDL